MGDDTDEAAVKNLMGEGVKPKMTQVQAGPTVFSEEELPRELLTVEAMIDSINHFFPFHEGAWVFDHAD